VRQFHPKIDHQAGEAFSSKAEIECIRIDFGFFLFMGENLGLVVHLN